MRLEHFIQVVTIAECGSFSKAAEKLFISQSNLSLSIKKLEEELGKPLFTRSRHGVELTPFGHSYVNLADNILLQVQQIHKLADDTQQCLPNLKLSVYNGGCHFVSTAVAELYMRHASLHPSIKIYEEGWHTTSMKFVAEQYCDIGIILVMNLVKRSFLQRLEALNLQYYKISNHPITISVGPKNPLFKQKSDEVSREQLIGYPLIIRETAENSNTLIAEHLGLTKKHTILAATSRASAYELVEKTNGFNISQYNNIIYKHIDKRPNIRFLKLKNCPVSSECGWIKRKDYAPTSLAMELLEIISGYYVE